jgi:hypothetical protein
VRHDDIALGHHLLHVPVAQAEAERAPDPVADVISAGKRWRL